MAQMGDAEDAIGVSLKRAAGRELSRDDDPDAEDEHACGQETGSFQRASEEIMATRRIVKVHQTQSSTGESPNPFASIELVPPVANPQVVDASKATEGCKVEAENQKIDEAGATELTEIAEKKVGEKEDLKRESTDLNSTELNTEEPMRKNKLQRVSTDLKPVEITEGEPNKEESSKEEPNKGEEEDDEEKPNTKSLERKQPAFVRTFQQLSNAQNAFTGVAGTGFSFSSFSFDTKITPFGSTPKFGSFNFSSTSAFGAPSSTGSLAGTGSLFGTKLVSDDSAPTDSSGTASELAAPYQLFGEPATDRVSTAGSGFGTLQEISVETGEEKEKSVFTVDAALFQYTNGGWKERGKGELRLNIPTVDTGRARLVMRARGNYRLILNTNLYPDMKLTGMEKRGFSFACINSSGDGKDGLATFALKFKDSLTAEDFQAAIEAHKDRSPSESRVPEISLKT